MKPVGIESSPAELHFTNAHHTFEIHFQEVEPELWKLSCRGEINDASRQQIHGLFDQIRDLRTRSGLKGTYNLIADVSELKNITPNARKGFRKHVGSRFEAGELRHVALVLPNFVIRTLFALIYRFRPASVSYSVHKDEASALRFLQKKGASREAISLLQQEQLAPAGQKGEEFLREEVLRLKQELASFQSQQALQIDRLFKLISSISWDEGFSGSSWEDPLKKEDPFNDLFDAATLLQADIRGMIRKQKDLNSNLERKVAERTREIAKKESNLLALIENTSDLVVSVDRAYRIIVMNSAYREMIRELYGKEARPGAYILDLVDASHHSFWIPLYESAFAGKPRKTVIAREVQGKTRHLDISFNPILDKEGRITGATIFAKDITEQKIAEDEIRRSQQLLSSINRNIREGIYRSTPDKGLVYVNRAFVEMFGYESAEELMAVESKVLYDDPERREELSQMIMKGKVLTNEEVLFVRKDGSRFYGMTSSIMSQDEQGNVFFDGAIRDVTESKEAERILREQNEQLKKINSELDRFVYSTSHDLRAPLVSISGLINIARDTTDETERQHYFDLMERSVSKLDNFIRDIMNYSRNARLDIVPEQVDLKQLVETIFEELVFAPDRAKLSLEVEVEGKLPFFTDSNRMKLIFNNILSNAARYHNPGRQAPFIRVKARIEPEWACITVQDNGMGIEVRHQERIFEMFYRASNAGDGSGLGLYIVKEALDKLGGRISVDSSPGEGTTFEFWVPNYLGFQERPAD